MKKESLTELFYLNPCPMWVFDTETHRFLEVNNAACIRYGYTREEFLQLTTLDIRPKSEQLKYHHAMKYQHGMKSTGNTFIHMDKSGYEFMVKPLSFEIMYEGKKALAIQIIDIEDYASERLRNKLLAAKLQKDAEALQNTLHNRNKELHTRIDNIKSMLMLLSGKILTNSEQQTLLKMRTELEQIEQLIQGESEAVLETSHKK